MRHFSFQEYLCMVIIAVYSVGIIVDIAKKRYKDLNFALSVILLVVSITITFITAPAFVVGESMEPTLKDKDVLMVDKFTRDFEAGDIVVLYSKEINKSLIKRIVAKGGDTVHMVTGDLYVNDKLVEANYDTIPTFETFDKITVPEGEYFVMGDNRPNSLDSRNENIGCIEEKYIYGEILR